MREYARVCPKFWTGRTGRWLRTQEPLIKVAAMYLMTCPYSEMTGLYYLPVDIMAHDIGCTPEEALKALKALKPLGSPLEGGFCDYDEKTETVWVFEMLRYQVGEVLKPKDNQIIGIKKSIEKYKNTPFYCQFIEKYGSSHCLCDTPPLSPLEAPSKPLPSPSRPSSKEKDKDIYSSSSYPHSSDKKEEVSSPASNGKPKKQKPSDEAIKMAEAWFDALQAWGDVHCKRTTKAKYVSEAAPLWDKAIKDEIVKNLNHVLDIIDWIESRNSAHFSWKSVVFSPSKLLTGKEAKILSILSQMNNQKPVQTDIGIWDRDMTDEEASELLRVTSAERQREDEMDRIRAERQKEKEDFLRTHGNLDGFDDL